MREKKKGYPIFFMRQSYKENRKNSLTTLPGNGNITHVADDPASPRKEIFRKALDSNPKICYHVKVAPSGSTFEN